MKKIFFTISAILLLFLITSCTDIGTRDYRTGTKGLDISFVKNSPPDSVFDDTQFETAVMIKNSGAYDITEKNPAELAVIVDEYYLQVLAEDKNKKAVSLLGKSLYYSEGDQNIYTFSLKANPIEGTIISPKTKIFVATCYPYKTVWNTQFCVDTSIYSQTQRDKACTIKNYVSSSGQGAPVAITRIEAEMLPQKDTVRPQFRIYIENKGSGYVLKSGQIDKICDPSITGKTTREDFNTVEVKATLSQKPLECKPNPVKLIDENTFVRCYVKDEDLVEKTTLNYVAPLVVYMDYAYFETISKEITIQRSSEPTGGNSNQQPSCGSYEVSDGKGNCVDKCTYCITNSNNAICNPPNTRLPTNFVFNSSLACACSKTECDTKFSEGKCAFGLCPGSNYCCYT